MKPENNMDPMAPFFGSISMDPTVHAHKPIIHSHDLYLVGEIGDAKNFISWFELIRNARANDLITIHINSPGGNLYTTLQLLRVIKESRASITTSIEGACMSAATMIFLAGDSFQVSDHSAFMVHDYSSVAYGKGSEQKSQVNFENTWAKEIGMSVYEDFLTEEEIEKVFSGIDIWMGSDEVVARLKTKVEKMKEDVEEVDIPDFENMKKIDLINWAKENFGDEVTITNKMTRTDILKVLLEALEDD